MEHQKGIWLEATFMYQSFFTCCRFFRHYQVVGTFSKAHPAGTRVDIRDEYSAERFLRNLDQSSSFWHHLLPCGSHTDERFANRSPLHLVAQQFARGRLAIYQLPDVDNAAVLPHQGGRGIAFFPGPEPLPHLTGYMVDIEGRTDAQTLLSSLRTTDVCWRQALRLSLSNSDRRTPPRSDEEARDTLVEYLASGKLRAYSCDYHPPNKGARELEFEDYVAKPFSLGPETPPPPAVYDAKVSQAEKRHVAKTYPEPKSLDEAAEQLAMRRAQIKEDGYQHKYSDEELLEKAQQDALNDRFFVRLIFGDESDAGENTLGYHRPSGRAPYWTAPFDTAEAADTDPEILAAIFGIKDFNPEQAFTLAIIDMEKMPPSAERESFVPTFDKMSAFGQRELGEAEGFGPGTMDEIMNEEFAAEYAGFMEEYIGAGESPYDSDRLKNFAKRKISNRRLQDNIRARHKVEGEFGANSLFSGNGLTKVTPDSRYADTINQQYGVVETFTFERDP